MNLIKPFSSNKYLYSFITVFIGGLLWLISNRFNISDAQYKGYDPLRYMDHAIYGCFRDYVVCSSPIVNLLKFLGNDTFTTYINFLLLVFLLLSLSISKKLLPYLILTTPTLIYYLPQTGKDSFTIIGSIALLSLLLDFSSREQIFNLKKGSISKNAPIFLLRISIIVFAGYLRIESLSFYIIITYIYFLRKSFFEKKNNLNKSFFVFIYFLILATAIYQISTNSSTLWLMDLLENSTNSGFASSRYSILIGNGIEQYFLRFIFYYIHSLLIPFIYLIRSLLFNFTRGFIYFGMTSLLLQNVLIFKNKLYLQFFITAIPYVTIISTFIFPHLRYFVIMFPAILIVIQLKSNTYNRNYKLNS